MAEELVFMKKRDKRVKRNLVIYISVKECYNINRILHLNFQICVGNTLEQKAGSYILISKY